MKEPRILLIEAGSVNEISPRKRAEAGHYAES
jgi:hypothetical protein